LAFFWPFFSPKFSPLFWPFFHQNFHHFLAFWIFGRAIDLGRWKCPKKVIIFSVFSESLYFLRAAHDRGKPLTSIFVACIEDLSAVLGKKQDIPFAINSSGSTFLPRLKLCRSRGSGFTPSYSMIQVDF
jgi:hypothetical protein